MNKHFKKLKESPRCPDCGCRSSRITPFGLECENCGCIYIPDGWFDDLEDVGEEICRGIKKAGKFIRNNAPKPTGKEIPQLLMGARALLKTIGHKAPEIINMFL